MKERQAKPMHYNKQKKIWWTALDAWWGNEGFKLPERSEGKTLSNVCNGQASASTGRAAPEKQKEL